LHIFTTRRTIKIREIFGEGNENVYLAWFTKRTWKLLVVCVLCPLPFPKIINWLGFLLQKHNKNIRAPVSLGKPKVLLKT